MSFIRWRQRVINRIFPQQANRRFIVPARMVAPEPVEPWQLVKKLWFDDWAGQVSGAMFDAASPGGVWQDTAGTIPAVAHLDPVLRADDLSGLGNHVMDAAGDGKLVVEGALRSVYLTASNGLVTPAPVAGMEGKKNIFLAYCAKMSNTAAQSIIGVGAGNVPGSFAIRMPATCGVATVDSRAVQASTAGLLATSAAKPTGLVYAGWGRANYAGLYNPEIYILGDGSYLAAAVAHDLAPVAQTIGWLCTGNNTAPNRGNASHCGFVWAVADPGAVITVPMILALQAWLNQRGGL